MWKSLPSYEETLAALSSGAQDSDSDSTDDEDNDPEMVRILEDGHALRLASSSDESSVEELTPPPTDVDMTKAVYPADHDEEDEEEEEAAVMADDKDSREESGT